MGRRRRWLVSDWKLVRVRVAWEPEDPGRAGRAGGKDPAASSARPWRAGATVAVPGSVVAAQPSRPAPRRGASLRWGRALAARGSISCGSAAPGSRCSVPHLAGSPCTAARCCPPGSSLQVATSCQGSRCCCALCLSGAWVCRSRGRGMQVHAPRIGGDLSVGDSPRSEPWGMSGAAPGAFSGSTASQLLSPC